MTPIIAPQVVEWVHERVPEVVSFGSAVGIGLEDGGIMKCGVVYGNARNDFQGNTFDVEMSIAAETPKWCSRGNLRMFFDYPFNQLGCKRVTAVTGKGNKRARKMLEGLGFEHEGTHKNGLPSGETAISYGMQKDKCRWL